MCIHIFIPENGSFVFGGQLYSCSPPYSCRPHFSLDDRSICRMHAPVCSRGDKQRANFIPADLTHFRYPLSCCWSQSLERGSVPDSPFLLGLCKHLSGLQFRKGLIVTSAWLIGLLHRVGSPLQLKVNPVC